MASEKRMIAFRPNDDEGKLFDRLIAATGLAPSRLLGKALEAFESQSRVVQATLSPKTVDPPELLPRLTKANWEALNVPPDDSLTAKHAKVLTTRTVVGVAPDASRIDKKWTPNPDYVEPPVSPEIAKKRAEVAAMFGKKGTK